MAPRGKDTRAQTYTHMQARTHKKERNKLSLLWDEAIPQDQDKTQNNRTQFEQQQLADPEVVQ